MAPPLPPKANPKTGHPGFLWSDLFRRRTTDVRPLVNILRDNAIFHALTPRELQYLISLLHERSYHAGETIFRQHDRGVGMYLILRGSVDIRTQTPGGETLVTRLTEGSFFGEIALVDPDNIRTAGAVANEKCLLIGFFKPDLTSIIERKPSLGIKIAMGLARVLGRRLVETTEKITELKRDRTPVAVVNEDAA